MTQVHTAAPLVFAAAPYLNAGPLTEGMRGRDDVALFNDAPSALAAYLVSHRADAALVPVVDLLSDSGLRMIEGLGVGADGKVDSVMLRCTCAPADVRSLAPDACSHSSNLLAQLLLRAHFGVTSLVLTPDVDADATVVIGDRALRPHPAVHAEYDLAQEWKNMTGLPFVFAVWAYRHDHPRAAELTRVATESYAVGRRAIDTIAERFAGRLGLTTTFCREYLTRRIQYTIGEHELRAIDRFADLLKQHELIFVKEPADTP